MVHFQIHKLYRDRNIDVFETVSIEELDPLRDESFYPNYRHVTPEFEQRRNRLNENPIAIVNRIFLARRVSNLSRVPICMRRISRIKAAVPNQSNK